jgi:ABC-type branched-subunit amino acid transport system substrate-binding protein
MNRKLTMIVTFAFFIAFAFGVQAADPMGEVKLRPGEPIHIAYWVVISGPNTSLGTDVVRGIEIAMDDFGGQIKGFPL